MNTIKNFVQIGSNVGNDCFFKLCKKQKNKSFIHLIEPNLNLIEELKNNYKILSNFHQIFIYTCGILPKHIKKYNTLYLYDDPGHSSALNRKSFCPELIKKEIKFTPFTFNEFCESNNIKNIEYLFIDAEGLDYEIINDIDLKQVFIKNIICEKWPYVDDDQNNRIKTGEYYFNKIKDKYKMYKVKEIILEGMPSFYFKKVI